MNQTDLRIPSFSGSVGSLLSLTSDHTSVFVPFSSSLETRHIFLSTLAFQGSDDCWLPERPLDPSSLRPSGLIWPPWLWLWLRLWLLLVTDCVGIFIWMLLCTVCLNSVVALHRDIYSFLTREHCWRCKLSQFPAEHHQSLRQVVLMSVWLSRSSEEESFCTHPVTDSFRLLHVSSHTEFDSKQLLFSWDVNFSSRNFTWIRWIKTTSVSLLKYCVKCWHECVCS